MTGKPTDQEGSGEKDSLPKQPSDLDRSDSEVEFVMIRSKEDVAFVAKVHDLTSQIPQP